MVSKRRSRVGASLSASSSSYKTSASDLDLLTEDNPPSAVIFGIEGLKLTAKEKELFKEANPLGFILFARNCESKEQLRALCASLHECVGRRAPILIDQEGGRVQRLKPPQWTQYPSAQFFAECYDNDHVKGRKALEDNINAIANDLHDVGFNVNCAPVLDVLFPETHDVIGDRAFSTDPQMVSALGIQAAEVYARNGVIPVIKHIPGHGRAASDSHKELPVVTAKADEMARTDFLPYRELLTRDVSEGVWAMVAHVVYKEIDPKLPATCSRKVIWDVIRQDIGFKGFLVSDDVCMDAMAGHGKPHRRVEDVLRGGCDVALHCNGKFEEIEDIAKRVQKMTKEAVTRYNRSVSWYKGLV